MHKLKILITGSAVLLFLLVFSPDAFGYSGIGIVDCDSYLNMRESPTTSAKIIDKLYPGTKISIESTSKGWHKITYNGKTGWVCGDYVSLNSPVKLSSRSSDSPSSSENSDKAQEIVDYAKKFLGTKYSYGGSSTKGFDCSGLTQFVFSKFGISLNRTASTQVSQGTPVKRDDLKKGDLVFFDTNGGHNSYSHVGIYIGDNKFIHAESGSVRRVVISSLTGYWSRTYMTARRIIK